jgi:hypothetical protein
LPSFEHATPGGVGFEQVAAVEPGVEAEANPFQKPNRFRLVLAKSRALLAKARPLLKKPSREFTIRAAVGAVALFVGWGVGAKPWKPSPAGRPVAALKAGAKANSAKAASAKATAAKATAARGAAGEPVRRVAAANQPAPARAATKIAPVKVTSKAPVKVTSKAVKPASKAPVAKAVTKGGAKTAKARPKTVAKAVSKTPVKAKAKVSAKASIKKG